MNFALAFISKHCCAASQGSWYGCSPFSVVEQLKMCRGGKCVRFFFFCSKHQRKSQSKFTKARNRGHLPWVTDTDHQPFHCIISAGLNIFSSVYSRPETESFDPSLRAHIKMKNCHSTVCWISPAPARSLPACTQHPNPKLCQLWMRSAALMWRSQPQVQIKLEFHQILLWMSPAACGEKLKVSTQAAQRSLSAGIDSVSDATELDGVPGSSSLEPFPAPALGLVLTISH